MNNKCGGGAPLANAINAARERPCTILSEAKRTCQRVFEKKRWQVQEQESRDSMAMHTPVFEWFDVETRGCVFGASRATKFK